MSYVGSSVKRIEDRPLLTGRARFAADLSLPDQLHMRVVRSPVAHGRLLEIDTSEAQAMDGVEAVWTRDDVREVPPIDFRMAWVGGLERFRQPVLAADHVRYVGEPVAIVLAADPYLAEDAAELVFAGIEELDPVVDPLAARPAAIETTVVEKAYGDLEGAFGDAPVVVEMELAVGRHSGCPWRPGGRWLTTTR